MFHLHNLMERQQYLLNKDTTTSDNLFLSQQNFDSDFGVDIRQHDINAKQSLSAYVYKEYWLNVITKKDNYQQKYCTQRQNHIVWPVGSIQTLENSRFFDDTTRCGCNF